MLRATSVPFTKEWKKWRAKLPPDPDFPSLKELPPRRGRPVDFHANQLVMDCKRLLIRYGCKYGVSRNRDRLYESPLKKLAELIHELSGVSALTQDKPWQDVVERLSSRSKRAKTIGKGNHETGLEEPMAAGEDPDFDAWFEEILKSWGY
jgi:hypothetical protein